MRPRARSCGRPRGSPSLLQFGGRLADGEAGAPARIARGDATRSKVMRPTPRLSQFAAVRRPPCGRGSRGPRADSAWGCDPEQGHAADPSTHPFHTGAPEVRPPNALAIACIPEQAWGPCSPFARSTDSPLAPRPPHRRDPRQTWGRPQAATPDCSLPLGASRPGPRLAARASASAPSRSATNLGSASSGDSRLLAPPWRFAPGAPARRSRRSTRAGCRCRRAGRSSRCHRAPRASSPTRTSSPPASGPASSCPTRPSLHRPRL